jgi:hypothetical protein
MTDRHVGTTPFLSRAIVPNQPFRTRVAARGSVKSGKSCIALITMVLALIAGCAPQPMLRFEPDAAPVVLMPAALAGVEDHRARYREILCAVLGSQDAAAGAARCEASLHRMAFEGAPTGRTVHLGPPRITLRLGVVPGYGAYCFADLVSVLADARAHIEGLGWPSDVLNVEGLSSSVRNAGLLRDQVIAAPLAPGERFVLIGYSKGAADMLEMLARYPETRPRVAAAVSLAGTVMGSPLADDPPRLLPVLAEALSGGRCTAGDGAAFASLRRTERIEFLARFPPASYGVPLYSLGAFASLERTSRVLQPMHNRLAAMDPRNDSQTLSTDQVIPSSALLGYLNADHWAVALPLDTHQRLLSATLTDCNTFPRAAMLEALLRLVEERHAERE